MSVASFISGKLKTYIFRKKAFSRSIEIFQLKSSFFITVLHLVLTKANSKIDFEHAPENNGCFERHLIVVRGQIGAFLMATSHFCDGS